MEEFIDLHIKYREVKKTQKADKKIIEENNIEIVKMQKIINELNMTNISQEEDIKALKSEGMNVY